MRTILPALSAALLLLGAGSQAAQGQAARGLQVRILSPQQAFAVGGAMPLCYSLVNETDEKQHLEMDQQGDPKGLTVTVGSADRTPVAKRHFHLLAGGFPLCLHPGVNWNEAFSLAPGEELLFGADLTDRFLIEQPGKYNVTVSYSGAQESFEFEVAQLHNSVTTTVRASCAAEWYAPRLHGGVRPAVCEVTTGQVKLKGQPDQCVAQVRLIGEKDLLPPGEECRWTVDREIKLVKTVMDFKWNLWAVFESKDRKCLVVFAPREGKTTLLVDWTSDEIELTKIYAIDWLKTHIAIAGIPGQPRITTLSLDKLPAGFLIKPSDAARVATER